MLKTIFRNATVKLPNKKSLYALQNLDTQNVRSKKYEMSESHTSPFLKYIKYEKNLVTLTEESLNTRVKNDHINRIDTNQ